MEAFTRIVNHSFSRRMIWANVFGLSLGNALVMLVLHSTVAAEPRDPKTDLRDDDRIQASAIAAKTLGTPPIAFLARVETGHQLGKKRAVRVQWAIGSDGKMMRHDKAAQDKPRIDTLGKAALATMQKELNRPGLQKAIQELPSRTSVPPDANYWILFFMADDTETLLRSWHPEAIASISARSGVSTAEAAQKLGHDYQEMIRCWSNIEHVFEKVGASSPP